MINNWKSKNLAPKFKKVTIFFTLFVVLLIVSSEGVNAFRLRLFGITKDVPGVLIVKVKNQTDVGRISAYDRTPELLFDRVYRIRVKDKQKALRDLRTMAWAKFVEEDIKLKIQISALDPLFVLDPQDLTKQWYLPKMRLHQAWEQTRGEGITIAVVDTGIDGKHEDLNDGRVIKGYASYCQVLNSGSSPDCLVRIKGELAPGVNSDDNGHGTIVAGILGAIANNHKGIAGINWNVRLMPIKALGSDGSGLASDVAVGIRWAADNGARVINLSIGGPGLQGIEVLQEAISYAFNKGVLIVSAAGNDAAVKGGSLNTNPVLPVCADGGQNMVIGVAAVDANDRKALFSNYGSNCVDIAAPGTGTFVDKQQKQGLISTYYDPTRPGEHDLYVYAVGTSVAAPMVSGVAALVMSVFPDLDGKAVRDRLIASVDQIDQANQTGCNGGSCIGQIGRGRLNALKAVTLVTTFSSGTLVKGAGGEIFLIERGLKRPISEFVFQQRFGGTIGVNATPEQLANYPTGLPVPPVDGSLVKEPTDPTVYLMEGGERHALSYLAFISRGLRFENVVTFSASEIDSYPRGRDASIFNGALMKAADHPAVFILNNSVRYLVSFFVFQQRQFQNLRIAVSSPGELAQYPAQPEGFLYPPLDGTLIRGDHSATVYLIEGGKRRGLTLQAFQNRGYRFADVKVLPQSEVDGYESGGDLLN